MPDFADDEWAEMICVPRSTANLGQVALTAARAGATAIRAVVDTGRLGTEFKSCGHDMVTAADKASERP